jgi:hypothetical protein
MNDLQDFEARFGNEGATAIQGRIPQGSGQATQIEQARAIAEVRAAVMIAMEHPRNEDSARAKMQRVCRMSALAERAFFRVPRGNKKDEHGNTLKDQSGKSIPEHVNGETIQLARELARCWGNIDYSVRELSRDDIKGQSEMMACAWDLEENVRPSAVFIVAHKIGKFRVTSNQQIYENNAGHAGRRLREMIFNALPEWFKAEAIELCHETLKKGDGTPMADRIAKAVDAFKGHGVSVEMIQKKIGRSIGEITPEDLATLRITLQSIKRGEVTVADEFTSDAVPAEEATKDKGSKLDSIESQIAGEPEKAALEPAVEDKDSDFARDLIHQFQAAKTVHDLARITKNAAVASWRKRVERERPELYNEVGAAYAQREEDFRTPDVGEDA